MLLQMNFINLVLKRGRYLSTNTNLSKTVPKKLNTNVMKYIMNTPNLRKMKSYIPEEYFSIKRKSRAENLYLIDEDVAKSVVKLIFPILKKNKDQIVCETNAGLGLIASELLDNGLDMIRLYEPCSEFRQALKDFNDVYPGRVELFSKDIFQLHRISYFDKLDRGNRLEQMLKNVKKKDWDQDVTMTIIGTMPTPNFIHYVMKMLAIQAEIIRYGRIQILAFIKPQDYIIFTAGPHLNLHTYQKRSVLFHLFFDITLLDKYPRKAFLPWETMKEINSKTQYAKRFDLDQLYFVQINLKKNLPVEPNHLLPLYYFVKQFFGRGNNKIIPTLEKWIPDCGSKLIVPMKKRKNYFEDMNIYTTFGQLTPEQLLLVFSELVNNPCYQNSPFISMVEAELLKSETVPSHVSEIQTTDQKTDIFQEKFSE